MAGSYPKFGLKGARIADLSWISGVWRGRVGDDYAEEYWSEPKGDSLLGMFRWIRAGAVKFYEIAAIEYEGDGVVLRFKHFDRGLIGWEEENASLELLLVYNQDREAAFIEVGKADPRWAVYKRTSDDVMVSYFTKNREPLGDPGVFEYRRRQI
jgi:hypothetical protein